MFQRKCVPPGKLRTREFTMLVQKELEKIDLNSWKYMIILLGVKCANELKSVLTI